uniref:RRM domain-containing protein n=1 Tax=Amphiprion ocellaris TaxID=80972 RepID=A0AAQ5YYY2_AMPOC
MYHGITFQPFSTEKCRGFGFVTYSMEEDAQRALKEIKEYDGQRLSLSVAKKKIKDKKKAEAVAAPKENEEKFKGIKKIQMKSRLIIRNLSFKCSEDDLKQVFEQFGTVLESKIPLKPDGKMRGFAFVMFKNVSEAAKALKAMNLKEIKGRQVAVDWAVPKDKYVATQQSSDSGLFFVFFCFCKSFSPFYFDVKPVVQQKEESDSSDEDDGEEEDSEEEESDEEEDDKEEEEEEKEDDDNDNDDDDDGSSLDSNDDQNESQDEEDDEDEEAELAKKLLPSDVKEGRTVFIRNLSFDTEEEGLEEILLRYGELNYIKIVLHPDTDHSKGCAFAQFKTKEAADKCIAAAQDEAENGGVRVDGRKLLIVAAVSREDATKMKVNKAKVETGTRNLYLAREGLIRAGTKAAEGVPEADMIKRTRFEEVKRAKLRDINVFVSKTRLCVHNLPKSVDNKKLKALCLQSVKGDKRIRITECRVMYDKKPEKGQVMGQSLGYGFVQFQDHEHALSALRYLNNNPDIFGSHKRPIVEFSLEDSRKLKIKEIRHQKNKVCVPERQKQDRYFSGFKTNPEVEHIDLENGKKRRKVLPLPSHRGPKIRKRDKGKQKAPPPKKAKPGSSWNASQRRPMEKPTQHKDRDRFDNLVEQYKKKLVGNGGKNTSIKRSKWFDS